MDQFQSYTHPLAELIPFALLEQIQNGSRKVSSRQTHRLSWLCFRRNTAQDGSCR